MAPERIAEEFELFGRIKAVVEKFDLSHCRWPMKLFVSPPQGNDSFHVQVDIEIRPRPNDPEMPERDVQFTLTFAREERLSTFEGLSDNDIAARIRWHVQQTLLHELDENILVGGERLFNPHRSVGDLSVTTVAGESSAICRCKGDMPDTLLNAKTATEEELNRFCVEWRGTNSFRAIELIGDRPNPRDTVGDLVNYYNFMRNVRFDNGSLKWAQRFAWLYFRRLPDDLKEQVGGAPEFIDDPYPV